ncbi:hypothetical protein PVAND_016773 [Polypedilum vanderplanki]|uniref:Uncharacterized protein n=1 Tax=Polypedilum vanderplanki TaxID=319348 RepID=A0A9J6BH60_POLVA|nr:hypothetical protein PVAND_016773 [Polypedilum vanderplanki]
MICIIRYQQYLSLRCLNYICLQIKFTNNGSITLFRDPSNIPSKEVISYAGKLATRLFYNVDDDEEEVIAETEVVSSEEMLLECKLDLYYKKDTVNVSKTDNKFKWLKQEFTFSKILVKELKI